MATLEVCHVCKRRKPMRCCVGCGRSMCKSCLGSHTHADEDVLPRAMIHSPAVALDPPYTSNRRWICKTCGAQGTDLNNMDKPPCTDNGPLRER